VGLHRRSAKAIQARNAEAAIAAVGAHYQYTQDRLAGNAGAPGAATATR